MKNKLITELFSIGALILCVLFYLFILQKNFPNKFFVLIILILINLMSIFLSLSNRKSPNKESYVVFEGFWLSIGFLVLSSFLMILEIIK